MLAAAWPRVSKDGESLAYVTEANETIVAKADGSSPSVVIGQEQFAAVDAPLFSPDGNLLYFSAVDAEPESQSSLWDRLLGVAVASAHSVPSDWWLMPADGSGEPERLTNLNAIGLYGDFSASGQHIAFITAEGVNVMEPDGTNIVQLQIIPTTGAIDWVP